MTAHYPDLRHKPVVEREVAGPTFGNVVYTTRLKRVVDSTLVLLSLPVVLPLILFMAFLVSLDGHKPFYVQDRIGRNGRTFKFWKLRTMVHDADARLANFLATDSLGLAEWTENQKLRCDPRVTRIGAFLRKTSLDELPQLWNVLRGDMSIVGPRPMMPQQRNLYPGNAYFRMRPGITGTWQVSDRNNCSFAARAQFDDDYFRSASFFGDLRIIAATVRVVFRATGC
jgi:exopolysaccharide production protein ExoY